ncbi:hypothetical protein SAMN02745704_00304 [Paucidesulfovibrio gracilis DSM 16080]|uniref:Uncharacterized protein n=1 Tax=Paucidesulfovibrio gracilis DSM 16080 TaxID=1121449 RepID=A0A1T4W4I5_9BACT|nr:DUF6125 family protein [Paucidesulfovibrio gracilis]SKA72166.1 hypothetical protein SAMN02745704_00304 [Paucidesulfovibrio gracilis DSM 16080]
MSKQFDLSVMDGMDRREVREYVSSLLWQLRLCDGFWFLNVEKRHGRAEAEAVNGLVWDKMGDLAARDVLERFGPFADTPCGFWKAYEYLPWIPTVECAVEHDAPDAEGVIRGITVTVRRCPAQAGREKHGLEPYECREMHETEFRRFAARVSPSVQVECVQAPPDPTPPEYDCRWRFVLPVGAGGDR